MILTPGEEKIIIEILSDYKNDYSFYLYGSRVKGNFEKTSDLDILIKGKEAMPVLELADLSEKMDNSNLPFIVNFSDYHNMDKHFYNLIEKDLVLLKL